MTLSVSLPFGLGLFETMRTYNGRIFREAEHLERLFESAKTAGVTDLPGKEILRRELKSAVTAYMKEHRPVRDLFLRLSLWNRQIFVMVGEKQHPKTVYQKGVTLRTSPVKRSLSNASPPEAKTSAYQNPLFASFEPSSSEVYEWVFLDQNGYVTEVRIGNIFIVQRDARPLLLTPPAQGILNGVTRRFVIKCAHEIGLGVREAPLTRHDIFNAEEAFLTNTSWEILPVRKLDGRKIGQKIPGPETLKLHRHFKQKILKECPPRKSTGRLSASRTKPG